MDVIVVRPDSYLSLYLSGYFEGVKAVREGIGVNTAIEIMCRYQSDERASGFIDGYKYGREQYNVSTK